ncbi:MAG: ribbon-helix-helix protein, CopG family [Candidatus Bathyarchaeia archaeon]
MKSITIRLRVEPEFKAKLQKAIAEGKADSMSELIRQAVTKFLEGEKP